MSGHTSTIEDKLDSNAAATWLGLARIVDQMLQDPKLSAQKSRSQIIRDIAQHRGVTSSSIEKPLRAFYYLNEHHPELIKGRAEVESGFVAILELERLQLMAPEEADRVASDVVDGTISLSAIKELRRVSEAHVVEASPGRIAGRMGLRQVAETDRWLADVITSNIQHFIREPIDSLDMNPRIDPVSPDILAVTKNGNEVAFEIKSGGSSLSRSHLSSILGKLALLDRIGLRVWFITPDEHRGSVEKLAILAQSVSLQCGLATIDKNKNIFIIQNT